jgi:hypothetical protein
MIYGPAFYKLLGIRESVSEPTAYNLLALDPRMVTERLVDEALAAQKQRVRHNIPGPQFIPIVAAIERELEAAAEILRHPQRRHEYNQKLLGRAKAAKDEPTVEQRCRIVAECREIVRSMVGHDGMLPRTRRDELAGRLRGAGMAEQDVRYVLGHIPSPPGETSEPPAPAETGQTDETGGAAQPGAAEDRPGARALAETMQFFHAAIDMEIRGGLLSGSDERKLMALATRLEIDVDSARPAIEERLSALGAARGERDESSRAGQSKPQEPSAPLSGPGAARPRRWGGLLVAGIVLGMSVLFAVVLRSQFSMRLPRGVADGNAPVAGISRSGSGEANSIPAAAPSMKRPPVVLDAALASLTDPAKVRKLLDRAASEDRTAAFVALAGTMVLGGTPRESVSAETLMKIALGCPSASPACQNAAVTALIDRLGAARESLDGGSSAGGPARRALGLLTGVLLLRAAPLADANDPDEVMSLLDRCRRAWRESVAAAPADPVNDPQRLAYAVVAGGSLDLYAGRADAARFGPLAAELAAMACDPNRPGSDKALAALGSAAGKSTFPPGLGDIARQALADAAASAVDAATAGRVLATLADAMGVDKGHTLRAMPLDSPQRRLLAAEAMREVIRSGAAPAPPPAPATRPVQALPARAFNAVLAFSVRRTWSSNYADEALLADLATTMLACAARVERFALQTDALDRELGAVLSQRNRAARTARLTRDVLLSEDAAAAVIDLPIALDPDVAEMLRKSLRSRLPGERLRAIDVLQRLGGPPAGEVLLERLDELVRTGGPSELTVINRILRALTKIDDPRLPGKLADLIEPAKTNVVANSIVMTLLDGTGLAGSTDRQNYLLPVVHTAEQRKAAAAQWQAGVKSVGWGPGRIDRALGVKTRQQVAWLPDGQTEKLLAAFVYYADISGQMLRTVRPAGQSGLATAPDVRPAPAVSGSAPAKIPAPVTGDELAVAAEAMANELVRLARAADAAGKFTSQLDAIENNARVRLAASRTALQAAAVRLNQAAKAMEVLLRQADGRKETDEALRFLRSAHEKVLAETTNVLDELRELAFQDLVLLEQLSPASP